MVLEMEGTLPCNGRSFLREKRRGIETEGIAFHCFLSALVDHPGGPQNLEMAPGPSDLLTKARIGREVGLGVPQAISMIGHGNVFGNHPPCLFQVGGASPEKLDVLDGGTLRQHFEEIWKRGAIEIGGKPGPRPFGTTGGATGREPGRGGGVKRCQGVGSREWVCPSPAKKGQGSGSSIPKSSLPVEGSGTFLLTSLQGVRILQLLIG